MGSMSEMSKPYVVVIPYPAQGHINSLLHVCRRLLSDGFGVIFINTDEVQDKIVTAASGEPKAGLSGDITFVSFPDGLGPEDDRTEFGKATKGLMSSFSPRLVELINSFDSNRGHISCVLSDIMMSWTIDVAHKLGITGASHWTMPAAFFHLIMSWPQLQLDGIIDSEGTPIKEGMIELGPGFPVFETANLPWKNCAKSPEDLKVVFIYIKKCLECLKLAEWWLCNSALELESATFALHPKLYPIGPLISTSNHDAQIWAEDRTCLDWLDQQTPKSVVYIAFGSFTIFTLDQFHELALALDLLGRPVLWVVRTDFTLNGTKVTFPEGYQGDNVKIVNWAPQLEVLSHPSVACFVSHCGWNSTMEGVSNGLPFLCWPYFSDQPMNMSYICDVWKVGFGLEKNENGMVTRDEVKTKVERLLGDEGIKERVSELKEVASKNIAKGGNSSKNLDKFVEWLKIVKPVV